VLTTLQTLYDLAVISGSFAVVLRLVQCLAQLECAECPFVAAALPAHSAFCARIDEACALSVAGRPEWTKHPAPSPPTRSAVSFVDASYAMPLPGADGGDTMATAAEEEEGAQFGSAFSDAAASAAAPPPPPAAPPQLAHSGTAFGLTWAELSDDVANRWIAAQNLAPVLMQSVALCYVALVNTEGALSLAFVHSILLFAQLFFCCLVLILIFCLLPILF
jgi:hypothetical protein